jgi:hypothetical protein
VTGWIVTESGIAMSPPDVSTFFEPSGAIFQMAPRLASWT